MPMQTRRPAPTHQDGESEQDSFQIDDPELSNDDMQQQLKASSGAGGGLQEMLALPPESRGGFTARALQALGRSDPIDSVLTSTRYAEPVTRAEAAAIAARLLGLGTALEGDPGVFSDVPVNHWAAAAIYRCREVGLFSGDGQNRFNPGQTLRGDHAEIVASRVGDPSARARFDRRDARQESDEHRQIEGGGDEVLAEVAESMSVAEGTAPDRIHYDSGIVNWGVGSNTGSHIATLLDEYEELAKERDLLEQLYGHFGGKGTFQSIRDRFRREGQGARLSSRETAYLQSLGRDEALVDAQYRKAGEDVAKYVGQIAAFSPPYPYADDNGTISEISAHVFSHAAHQSGSATGVYRSVMADLGGRDPSGQMSEQAFLQRVADKIVSWVQARYRVGVRNRYRTLFETYGRSSRRVSLSGGGGGGGVALEGQVSQGGEGAAGVEVEITDAKGNVTTATTNARGFFEVQGELEPGEVQVRAGGRSATVSLTQGRAGWAQLSLDGQRGGALDEGGAQGDVQGGVEGDQDSPGPQQGEDAGWFQEVGDLYKLVLDGQMRRAKEAAASTAARFRAERGLDGGSKHPVTDALGLVWQVADKLGALQQRFADKEFEQVKQQAHDAAERSRELRDRRWVDASAAERVIKAAGGWWSKANEAAKQVSQPEEGGDRAAGDGDAGRKYGVWTTGRRGGGGVTSVELARDGSWSPRDFLAHHSDRSNSWAARQIRDGKNRDLQAYDFTFEATDAKGRPMNGTAQGLDLITPWDAKVLDVQPTFEGSGGLGKFIVLEDVETGLRISVHHLDGVGDFRRGQLIRGGQVFGQQGGAGNTRHTYATHVDIVGTQTAVEQFVRANQSGEFKTRATDNAAVR